MGRNNLTPVLIAGGATGPLTVDLQSLHVTVIADTL
jgi:hypothetical protein